MPSLENGVPPEALPLAREDLDTHRPPAPVEVSEALENPALPKPSPDHSRPIDVDFDEESALAIILELRRLKPLGPAAKGRVDECLQRLRTLLHPLAAEELARALSTSEFTSEIGTVVLQGWLSADPLAACEWMASHPAATEHHAWLAADALVRKPDLLAIFCDRLPASAWAEMFLDSCTRTALRENPRAAVSFADALPPGERRTRALETIACDWMLNETAAARAWIQGVQPAALRQQLALAAAETYASSDPLAALEWLLTQLPADATPTETIQKIAEAGLHAASPQTLSRLRQLSLLGHPRTPLAR